MSEEESEMDEEFEGFEQFNLQDERWSRITATEMMEQYLNESPPREPRKGTETELSEQEYHYLIGGFIQSRGEEGVSGFEAEAFLREIDITLMSMTLIDMGLRGLVRVSMNDNSELVWSVTKLGEEIMNEEIDGF